MMAWRRRDLGTGANACPSISRLSSLRMFLSTAPMLPLPMVASGARPREPAPERGASGPAVPGAASQSCCPGPPAARRTTATRSGHSQPRVDACRRRKRLPGGAQAAKAQHSADLVWIASVSS